MLPALPLATAGHTIKQELRATPAGGMMGNTCGAALDVSRLGMSRCQMFTSERDGETRLREGADATKTPVPH